MLGIVHEHSDLGISQGRVMMLRLMGGLLGSCRNSLVDAKRRIVEVLLKTVEVELVSFCLKLFDGIDVPLRRRLRQELSFVVRIKVRK